MFTGLISAQSRLSSEAAAGSRAWHAGLLASASKEPDLERIKSFESNRSGTKQMGPYLHFPLSEKFEKMESGDTAPNSAPNSCLNGQGRLNCGSNCPPAQSVQDQHRDTCDSI
jgi:hypothetical protein